MKTLELFNKKYSWAIIMAILACIPIIFLDWIFTQSTNNSGDEQLTTGDPQTGITIFIFFLSIILPVFYLKLFTYKNKISHILLFGLSLLLIFTISYFLIYFKHIENYIVTFSLIFFLNIFSFKSINSKYWNSIGLMCIFIFIILILNFINKT